MNRIASLGNTPVDPIQALEAEHDVLQVAVRISPKTQFVLDNVQRRLGVSRSRAALLLLESAALDWVEAQDIDPEGDHFKDRYMQWLSRKPQTAEELGIDELDPDELVYPVVTL